MTNTNIESAETITPKKRGRPAGSKNKNGSAAKSNKEKPVQTPVVEPTPWEDEPVASVSHETTVSGNPSGILPFEFKVLVKPDEVKKVTDGGILLPDDPREQEAKAQMKGTIIAISPGAFSYHMWPSWVSLPRVGDRVLYSKYGGSIQKGKDGVEYRLVNDKDIGAIIDF